MKKFKRVVVILIGILMVSAVGFGYNFFSDKSEVNVNDKALTVKGEVTVQEIAEKQGLVPGDNICNAIKLNINSTAVSLLRVKVDVLSEEANQEANQQATKSETNIFTITGIGENWINGNDGYYYYNAGVKQDDEILFANGIKFEAKENTEIDINEYQGKTIKANIQAEMIQAKYGVFETAWNISLTNNESLYNTLKAISDAQNTTTKTTTTEGN